MVAEEAPCLPTDPAAELPIDESEVRYRRLFETAHDAILILDGDGGKIMDANPFVIDLLGYSLDELIGKELWEIGLFADVDENKRAFDELQRDGYIRYDDLPLETKDGRQVNVEFVSNVYEVKSCKVIQCNIRDITERGKAARALRNSELRYRRLFETAQDAILIVNADSRRIIDANPYVINLLGYSLEELIGKELWQIGLFRDIEESKAAFDRLQRDGYIRYEDLPLETKDGKRAEVEFVSNTYDVDGEAIIQCNIRDITDRKSAERAAREGAERFRFLAESMPQMIFTAQPKGDVDYFNQQWSTFTGLTLENIKDWRWTKFIHPDDAEKTSRHWRQSLDTGEPFESQHRIRRADGVYRWHLSRATPMRDAANNITMWISSNTDIEDQKRTEDDLSVLYKEASSLNRAKDEFLATLSHELRTPMTSILGWTALLSMTTLDESTRREGIATIHRSAQVQAQLIDDVLDVSRMITGKLQLNIEPVDMEVVLRAAVTAVIPAAEAKGIRIGMTFEPGLPRLGADPFRLQQVIWNLLSNALKFTPAGGHIELRLFVRNGNMVVDVSDTGIGITAAFLPYAFDRFAQQEGGTMRHHGGMGIGLSIVKQLIELHGGRVSVASEGEGRGATFTLAIPIQEMPPKSAVPADAVAFRPRPPASKKLPSISGVRVLVVDDERDSRRTISAILELHGAIVTAAASAAEGLVLSGRHSFDILLCDIAMPEQDGYSLIRNIRAPADKKSRVPAVALTAYGRPAEREIALGEGFDEYLKKPVEPEELISLVASMASPQR
jgi:PAS domain S-box-containing protein